MISPQWGQQKMRRLHQKAVDAVFARIDDLGNPAWYLTDNLGSVRDLIGNSAGLLDHLDYTPFGQIAGETNPTTGDRYKYTSREWDTETQLQYNRARYYDPTTRRWISQDPLGFDAGDGNLYRYVKNRPLSVLDPSGTDPVYNAVVPDDPTYNGYPTKIHYLDGPLFELALAINPNKDVRKYSYFGDGEKNGILGFGNAIWDHMKALSGGTPMETYLYLNRLVFAPSRKCKQVAGFHNGPLRRPVEIECAFRGSDGKIQKFERESGKAFPLAHFIVDATIYFTVGKKLYALDVLIHTRYHVPYDRTFANYSRELHRSLEKQFKGNEGGSFGFVRPYYDLTLLLPIDQKQVIPNIYGYLRSRKWLVNERPREKPVRRGRFVDPWIARNRLDLVLPSR